MTGNNKQSMTRSAMDGIIAVPATPFTDGDQVDVESLRRYVRRSMARGVVGFLAPAVAGEVETLTLEERDLVVATIVDEVGGRVPVIGGASDPDPAVRPRLAGHFIKQGCDGILAHLRYEDEDRYVAAVEDLGGLEPGFLMIQDLDTGPAPVGLLARLHREVPALKWAKIETSDRCGKCTALLRETEGSLRVGSGGPDLIELLDRGVHAYMPTLYHGVYVRIWSLHRSGRRGEAVGLWRRLLPCLSFVATHQKIQWHVSKAVLKAEGIFETTRLRVDAPEPDAFETRLIEELVEYANALTAELAGSLT
jgi:4-hydroxy-tetrahydrodipicolinate synthase